LLLLFPSFPFLIQFIPASSFSPNREGSRAKSKSRAEPFRFSFCFMNFMMRQMLTVTRLIT
jgi:hypothetical protein